MTTRKPNMTTREPNVKKWTPGMTERKDTNWDPKGTKRDQNGANGMTKGSQSKRRPKIIKQSAYPLDGGAIPRGWGEVSSPLPPSALGAMPGILKTSARLNQKV